MSHEHVADEFSLIFIRFIKCLCRFSFDVPQGTVGNAYASTGPDTQLESQINNGEYLQEVTRTFNRYDVQLSINCLFNFCVSLASTFDLEQYIGTYEFGAR